MVQFFFNTLYLQRSLNLNLFRSIQDKNLILPEVDLPKKSESVCVSGNVRFSSDTDSKMLCSVTQSGDYFCQILSLHYNIDGP